MPNQYIRQGISLLDSNLSKMKRTQLMLPREYFKPLKNQICEIFQLIMALRNAIQFLDF